MGVEVADLYARAGSVFSEAGRRDSAGLAFCLSGVVRFFLLRSAAAAIAMFDSARLQYRLVPDPMHLWFVTRSSARARWEEGRLEEAGALFGEQLELERGGVHPEHRPSTLLDIGGVWEDVGMPDSAHAAYRDAAEASFGVSDTELVYPRAVSADADLELRDLEAGKALRILTTALGDLPVGGLRWVTLQTRLGQLLLDVHDSTRAVEALGRALDAVPPQWQCDIADPNSTSSDALPWYQAQIEAHLGLGNDAAARRCSRGVANQPRIADRLRAHLLRGRLHNDSRQAEKALSELLPALDTAGMVRDRFVEAQLNLEVARSYRMRAAAGDTSALLQGDLAFASAASRIRAVSRSAGSDRGSVLFTEHYENLFADWALVRLSRGGPESTRRALESVERGRAQALLSLRHSTAPALADSTSWRLDRVLAALATESTAVLTYLTSRDTLLWWFIPPAGPMEVVRRPVPRCSLDALVRGYRRSLGVDDVALRNRLRASAAPDPIAAPPRSAGPGTPCPFGELVGETPSSALARLLLPEQLARRLGPTKRLLIVPQGLLGVVPFAALPTPGYGALPLGVLASIRYAPSLASLADLERTSADVRLRLSHRRVLIAANPRMPVGLRPLPGAAEEGEAVADVLAARPMMGAAATEGRVFHRLAGADLAHFATHGAAYASLENAGRSFVALAPSLGGDYDGLLTVDEILHGPPLHAELVVLSACQTGLGRIQLTEGIIGLPRAFLAQGARSVLVSLWSVSDRATELLMRRFYAHWLEDADRPDKAEALRRAQDDVRETGEFRQPRYWAAFQLVGAP